MFRTFDFLVIGAGAAGASAAYALSAHGRVALLEQEAQAGYHSTSRSAAVLSEAYGPKTWQIIAAASRSFYESPPDGFADHPLTRPLGSLFLGRAKDEAGLRDQAAQLKSRGIASEVMSPDAALRLSPAVRPDGYTLALFEAGSVSLDAGATLQGFLRLARRNRAETFFRAAVTAISRRGAVWHVETTKDSFEAPVIINAAGAWADGVAHLAGVGRRGVQPFRRTAITFDPPQGSDAKRWPMTFDMDETWYFKPEGRHIMASPADLIATEPGDAQPEELDVAVAVDRIETATTLKVGRLASRWAGLRTFAPDHEAVIGPDPSETSFIWYAGQGGNGVMASAAGGELAAAAAVGLPMPARLEALGLAWDMVSPRRLAPS
ncbi:MAG: FAD-dependent oxidoreductase [Hyphomicrobiaceae bacterium]